MQEPWSCAWADLCGAGVGHKELELPFMACGVLDIQALWFAAKSVSCWHVLLKAAHGAEPCAKSKAPSSPSTLHPHTYLLGESTYV